MRCKSLNYCWSRPDEQPQLSPFGRVVTAMVTPFAADGSVDLPLAARLAQHLVANGSDGLVVCGTTGESPTLSWDEQLALIKTVLDAVGEKVPVWLARAATARLKRWKPPVKRCPGAHGALVVVPYYNRPPGRAGGPFPRCAAAAPSCH